MKHAHLTLGNGQLSRENVDSFCGLLAEHLRTLLPKGGQASVTVRVDVAEAMKPARAVRASRTSELPELKGGRRRRRR